MQNKFTLTIVIIVAIFLGVTITVQQANHPIMRRLVAQQEEILSLQKKMDRVLSGEQGAGDDEGSDPQSLAVVNSKLDAVLATLKPLQDMQKAQQAPQAPSDEFVKVHNLEIGQSPIKGNKDAPVTIVEFMDFQCPFCSRFHPVVNEVLAAYPDKVNYVLKNYPLPFHQLAKPASKAALAAGEQGKYYEMAELLLQNHEQLSEEKFQELAKALDLNVEKFMSDFKEKDAEWEKIIQDDMTLGEQAEVRGTPTYFINGRKTTARNLAMYKKEIEEILNKK